MGELAHSHPKELASAGGTCDPGSMRTPLIERLPDDAPQLTLFDDRVGVVEMRRSIRPYSKATQDAHRRRFRRWQEWCQAQGYQWQPEFITAEKLHEWTLHMVTVQRYAPPTIWQALRALEVIAERAGVHVSVEPALGVLDQWREKLFDMGVTKERPRGRRRARASVPS